VGLRAGLDKCGKSRPPPGFDPRTVQPVGSRYTDYATRPEYVLLVGNRVGVVKYRLLFHKITLLLQKSYCTFFSEV